MTTVAYLVFTFVACVFGLGLGLLFHHLRAVRNGDAVPPALEDTLVARPTGEADVEATTEAWWNALSQWQARNNRSFALHVGTFSIAPLVAATMAWGMRDDVVGSVCARLSDIATQPPICF